MTDKKVKLLTEKVEVIKPKINPKTSQLDEVDEALEESFPASDPPSWTLGPEEKRD